MERMIFWIGIVTEPIAIVQAIVACIILLKFLIMAIGVGRYTFEYGVTLRIMGINIGSSMYSNFALIMTIIVLVAAAFFTLSVLLCVGIRKNKTGYILLYVSCAGGVTIGRMSMLTKDNFRDFPDDKTVLYLGLYILYLILLVVLVVYIKRARRQESILNSLTLLSRLSDRPQETAVPMANPEASYEEANCCTVPKLESAIAASAPSCSPMAPPAYEDVI